VKGVLDSFMIDIKEKGIQGELALKQWFDSNDLSYVYIDQSTDYFSTMFQSNVKRPDFLLLLDSIGILAIDVKNYTFSGGVFTLGMTDEFQKAITFERIFRLPLWYVYKKDEEWFWISALKAIEVGTIRKNSSTNKDFLAIPIKHFEKIVTGEDMGSLYTHRLPKIDKISTIPVNEPLREAEDIKPSWEEIYDFSCSYYPKRIKNILAVLSRDVEFPIIYRRGGDRSFSTLENSYDYDLVALIDYFNVQIMFETNTFASPITTYGEEFGEEVYCAKDHLIYAVSSAFYDDKNGSNYTINLDLEKLTELGAETVARFIKSSHLAQISMGPDPDDDLNEEDQFHAGYSLFATIE
jgi:hypothetical protein